MFLHLGTSWRCPACTIRVRAEVLLGSHNYSAPRQNALRSIFLYYSNLMASIIILEGCAPHCGFLTDSLNTFKLPRHRVSVCKLFSAWSYTSHKLPFEIMRSLTCVYPSDKHVWWFTWKLTRRGSQPSSNTKHDVDDCANHRKSPKSQCKHQYGSCVVPIIAHNVVFAKRKQIFSLTLMTNQKLLRNQ